MPVDCLKSQSAAIQADQPLEFINPEIIAPLEEENLLLAAKGYT